MQVLAAPSIRPPSPTPIQSVVSLSSSAPAHTEPLGLGSKEDPIEVFDEIDFRMALRNDSPMELDSPATSIRTSNSDATHSTQCSPKIMKSNTIKFTFRTKDARDTKKLDKCRGSDSRDMRSIAKKLEKYAVIIDRSVLSQLQEFWLTGTSPLICDEGTDHLIRATFVYETYCRETDWQIIRKLSCYIWGPHNPSLDYGSRPRWLYGYHTSTFFDAIRSGLHPLRHLAGSISVAAAMNSHTLIFRFLDFYSGEGETQWITSDHAKISKSVLRRITATRNGETHPKKIRSIRESNGEELLAIDIPDLSEINDSGAGVLAMREDWWPESTPRFCLFVYEKEVYNQANLLANLLERIIRDGRPCLFNRALDRDDKSLLNHWLRELVARDEGSRRVRRTRW